MKIYLETRNGSFFGMDTLPEDAMEDKGGIKPCSVSLYIVDSLCNYGKTVNQLLLKDISAEIEVEFRPSW